MKRKKVLFHSDFALSKTGFGRNLKAILCHLFKKDKYDLISVSGGVSQNHPELDRTPWKSIGVVPRSGPEKMEFDSNPEKRRMYSYGAYAIDKIIQEEKPDVYIGIQDIWGLDYSIEKPWFKNINSVIWTTLDSLPLLQKAVDAAPKIKNYWIWADFATEQMHKLGHKHVRTIRGCVDDNSFKPLSVDQKLQIRQKHGIEQNDFIIGFVFRNQLRKSLPNLLSGYKIFKEKNPTLSTKLLLHTGWHEGWNIQKQCKEKGVDLKDILTTYICKHCGSYKVQNFIGPEIQCPHCSAKGAFVTTSTNTGVREDQLNEIYNCMDVYCHPFTSGGQEIPIQEAKLSGLITLVTNYSCGQDMCVPEAASIPLEWDEYSEFGTEFIKASTRPNSIAESLQKVLEMPNEEKIKLSKNGRRWVLNNFGIEKITGQIEDFIDDCPEVNYDFLKEEEIVSANPDAPIPDIKDDKIWLMHLYKNILGREISQSDEGFVHWINKIKIGMSRATIENYFRSIARQEVAKFSNGTKTDLLEGSTKEERILVKIDSTQANIFLGTKIIAGIKKKYPDKKIIVYTNKEAAQLLIGNSNIFKAFVQGKEFRDADFIKEEFFECYSLNDFSIDNNHYSFLK